MGRMSWIGLRLSLAVAVWVGGCHESHGAPSAGSNTNWLRCASDDECDESQSCLCGTCTKSCESNAECAELDPGAICQATDEGVVERLCGEAPEEERICVLPCVDDADCEEQATDMSCVDAVCMSDAVFRSLADVPVPSTDGGVDSSVDGGPESAMDGGADSAEYVNGGADSSTDAGSDSPMDGRWPQPLDAEVQDDADASPALGDLGGPCLTVETDEDASVGGDCDGDLVCGPFDVCEPACDEQGRCLIDGLPRGRTMHAMVDDGEAVYLRYAMTPSAPGNPNRDGALWRVKPGEDPQMLLEGLTSDYEGFLAVDDTHLYFLEEEALLRVEKGGGPGEEVFSSDIMPSRTPVLVDGYFYAYDSASLVISRASATPGASFETFHTLDTSICSYWYEEEQTATLWSDDGVLFIQVPDSVISWDLRESGSQPVCEMGSCGMDYIDVQADGQYIYWTDDCSGYVRRMPRGGGESADLVSMPELEAFSAYQILSIRVVGDWVYWYEWELTPLVIYRAPLEPGTSETVLSVQGPFSEFSEYGWVARAGGPWAALPTAVVWVYEGLVYYSEAAVQ